MCQLVISLLSFDIENIIGEIVILVNDQIESQSHHSTHVAKKIEFVTSRFAFLHQLHEFFGIKLFVFNGKEFALYSYIVVQTVAYVFKVTSHFREVKVHHKVFIVVFCRMLSGIHSLEQLLEVVLLIDVVVGFEHVQKQALAEAARADEKEKIACPFHPLEVHGLIYQVFVFLAHLLEVGDAVGYALEIVAHCLVAYR